MSHADNAGGPECGRVCLRTPSDRFSDRTFRTPRAPRAANGGPATTGRRLVERSEAGQDPLAAAHDRAAGVRGRAAQHRVDGVTSPAFERRVRGVRHPSGRASGASPGGRPVRRRRRRAAALRRRRRGWQGDEPLRSALSSRSSVNSCARRGPVDPRASGPWWWPVPSPVRSTESTASSADRALSTSRRSANCVCSTCSSSRSPLRSTSSVASAAGPSAPWRISELDRRMPNSPKRASSRSRTSVVTSASRPARRKRSTDSSSVSRSSRAVRASVASAVCSACRSVRAVCASKPATATTFWQSPRTVGSARYRAAMPRAENIASTRPRADLVRARENGHGVDRRGPGDALVAERLEERRVLGVDVAHEVHDRVRLGRRVVVRVEERDRPARDVLRRRGDTGRVDQGRGPQALRRPVDHQPLALLGGRRTEVDLQRAVVPAHGQRPGRADVRVQHDPWRRAVAVPCDHACALAGVGRCHLFSDERVEQCRLARLTLPAIATRRARRAGAAGRAATGPSPAGGGTHRSRAAAPGGRSRRARSSGLPRGRRGGLRRRGGLGNQRPCLLADQVQLLQLLRDLGQPGLPLGPRRLHRAFGGLL